MCVTRVNEKTNEIPVFRDMLDFLDIKGKIITADAMACQKETVAKIIEKECDYCIGLKGNQGTLHKDVQLYFEQMPDQNLYEVASTSEKSRDRCEKRICHVFKDISWLEQKPEWRGLKSIIAVHRITEKAGIRTDEVSFYISSLEKSPAEFLNIIRNHWQIEVLHWCLDVIFNEDGCLLQNTNAQLNLNLWRKFALSVHKNFKTKHRARKA